MKRIIRVKAHDARARKAQRDERIRETELYLDLKGTQRKESLVHLMRINGKHTNAIL